MKWKQKLSEVGLTEQTISHGLRNKIKAYYDILEGINEAKETIANPSLNDDVEAIKEELPDLEEALEDADRNLVKAIELYDKNKERYAELSKHLSKGRPRKDGTPAKPKETTPASVSTTAAVVTPAAASNSAVVLNADGKPTEEKKSNFIVWALGAVAVGIVAVVTLGRARN